MATIRPSASVRPERGPVVFQSTSGVEGAFGETKAQLAAAEARKKGNAASILSQAGALKRQTGVLIGQAGDDFLAGSGDLNALRVELGAASRRIDEREDAIRTAIIERDWTANSRRLFEASKGGEGGGFATQESVANFKLALAQSLEKVFEGEDAEANKLLLGSSKLALRKSLGKLSAGIGAEAAAESLKVQRNIMNGAMDSSRRRMNDQVSSAPHYFKEISANWEKMVREKYAPTANTYEVDVMVRSGKKAFALTALSRYYDAQDFDSVRRVLDDPETVDLFTAEEMREQRLTLAVRTKDFGSERDRLISEQNALLLAEAAHAQKVAADTQAEILEDAKRLAEKAKVDEGEANLRLDKKVFEFGKKQAVSDDALRDAKAEVKAREDALLIKEGAAKNAADKAAAEAEVTAAKQALEQGKIDLAKKELLHETQTRFLKEEQALEKKSLELQRKENDLINREDKAAAAAEIAKGNAELAKGIADLRQQRLEFAEKNFEPKQKAELARLRLEADKAQVAAEKAANEAIRIQNQNKLTSELQAGKDDLKERELKLREDTVTHGEAKLAFERDTSGAEDEATRRVKAAKLAEQEADLAKRAAELERQRVELEREKLKVDQTLAGNQPPLSSKSHRSNVFNYLHTNLDKFREVAAKDAAQRNVDEAALFTTYVGMATESQVPDPVTKQRTPLSGIIRDALKEANLDPDNLQSISGARTAIGKPRAIGPNGLPEVHTTAPTPAVPGAEQSSLPSEAAALANLAPVGPGGLYNSVNRLTGPGPATSAFVADLPFKLSSLAGSSGTSVIAARTRFSAFKGALTDAFVRTDREGQSERTDILKTQLKDLEVGFLRNDDALATRLAALDQFLDEEMENIDIALSNFGKPGSDGGASPDKTERGRLSNRRLAIIAARKYIGAPPYANNLDLRKIPAVQANAQKAIIAAILRYERANGVQLVPFDPATGFGGRIIINDQIVPLNAVAIQAARNAAAAGN